MTSTTDQKRILIEKTEALMNKANIEFRDTWKGLEGENLDDEKTNKQRNGPRLLEILIDSVRTPECRMKEIYDVDGHECIAYDCFTIHIPFESSYKKSAFIHEIVHFLQVNTRRKDKSYISLNKNRTNYSEYAGQRSELEAHLVQILYIYENELNIPDIGVHAEFSNRIQESLKDESKRLPLIIFAKDNGII